MRKWLPHYLHWYRVAFVGRTSRRRGETQVIERLRNELAPGSVGADPHGRPRGGPGADRAPSLVHRHRPALGHPSGRRSGSTRATINERHPRGSPVAIRGTWSSWGFRMPRAHTRCCCTSRRGWMSLQISTALWLAVGASGLDLADPPPWPAAVVGAVSPAHSRDLEWQSADADACAPGRRHVDRGGSGGHHEALRAPADRVPPAPPARRGDGPPVTLPLVPWQLYLEHGLGVGSHLGTAWNGSAWRFPILIAPTLVALWVLRRNGAEWFAVPAIFPATQFYVRLDRAPRARRPADAGGDLRGPGSPRCADRCHRVGAAVVPRPRPRSMPAAAAPMPPNTH